MKIRLISSAVGLVILAVVLTLFDTIVLNIVVSAIIAMAIYELLKAAGQIDMPIAVSAILFGATIPFFETEVLGSILPTVCFAFAVLLLSLMLRYHGRISAEKIGFLFFFGMAIALSASCFVYVRDVFGTVVGLYAVLLSLGGAWTNDAGAYFCGRFFGRRKLAPVISPKKTVEGFIGGVAVALICQLLLSALFVRICLLYGIQAEVNYAIVAAASPFIALAGVLGDLAASALKRQFGVKDFGNIMPGHGGVLDRFDSAFVTIPLVYNILLYFPLITVR